MKNFALIGAAGYIAPRHMKAIKETGNNLIMALDSWDSVGQIDAYFPEANFFTEFERFDRHAEKTKKGGQHLDFVSICSPNYLHDAHMRFAMRIGADAICEKPVVLNPWNLDALQELELEYGKKINTILQLRLHPAIIALKERIAADTSGKRHNIVLTYITSRGKWYDVSWKGEMSKSGGIATNIGVHFFDMLGWIFGKKIKSTVHCHQPHKASGFLELERADVQWFLSIDRNDLPLEIQGKKTTYRTLQISDSEFEFSEGFTDLHTDTYKAILAGNGFGLAENRQAIEIVHEIRNAPIAGLTGDYHPYLKNIQIK